MNAPRFVELVRVSSVGQSAKDTPAIQRQALDALRQTRPGVCVERIEAVISGNALASDRADLLRLAELTEAKAYNEIRIWRLDRLSRSEWLCDAGLPFDLGRKVGAMIVDCNGEQIDTRSTIGRLIFSIKIGASSEEREKIRDRTMGGKRAAAAAGRKPGGPSPYALRYDKKTGWALDPAEAEVYRRLFREVLAGRSLPEIAEGLRTDNVPARRSRWTTAHVHRLLRSPTALGAWKTYGTTIAVPAVVDAQTQAAALALLATRRTFDPSRLTRHPAMLRRLLRCGECDRTIRVSIRAADRTTGARRTYYCCRVTADEFRPLAHGRATFAPVADTDALVRAEVERVLSHPEILTAALRRQAQAPARDFAAELAKTRADEGRLQAAEVQALRLLERGALSEDTATQRLEELRARRQQAVDHRRELEQATTTAAPARLQDVGKVMRRLAESLRQATREEVAEALRILFPQGLRLFPDRIEGTGCLTLPNSASCDSATGGNKSVPFHLTVERPPARHSAAGSGRS